MKVSTRTSTLNGFSFASNNSTNQVEQQTGDSDIPYSRMQLNSIQGPNQFTINQNLRGMQTFTKTNVITKTCNKLSRWITILCLIVTAMAINVNVFAQAPSQYQFAGSSSTYAAISGGTTLGSTALGDDVGIGNLPIGFTFNYNGIGQTVFGARSNGLIELGQTAASLSGFSSNSLATNANCIAGFWDDNNTSGGSIIYNTTGSAGSRILTVQFTGMHVGGGGSSASPTMDLQILLFEGSNNIQIRYGTSQTLSGLTVSIGLSGNTGNYLSVTPQTPASASTASSATENSSISSANNVPSGTVYSFSPPPPCTIPTAQPTNLVITPIANSFSFSGSFSAATPSPDGYLVVRTTTNVAPAPVNGTGYSLGDNSIGYVESNTTATTFTSNPGVPSTTYYYWVFSLKNSPNCTVVYLSASPLTGSATSNSANVPSCPTIFTPADLATNIPITGAILSWDGATAGPGILGYDVYFGTDKAQVEAQTTSLRVSNGQPGKTFALGTLLGNTTYYWLIVPANSVGRGNCTTSKQFTTHGSAIKTSVIGGLWSSPATWGGTTAADLPLLNDDVVIPDGVIVSIDQTVTARNLTVGQGGAGSSVLQWASSNTLNVTGNLVVSSNGRLLTHIPSGSGQTLNLGGNLTNNGFANLAAPGTFINFNGSQQVGGSSSQNLNGTGTFVGNAIGGIIPTLQIATTGNVSIGTSQFIVVNTTFNNFSGTLITNNNLRIDNTAIVHGQAFNKQVAGITVTGMGSGYTAIPVVSSSSAALWATGSVSIGAVRINGSNVYVALSSGTAATAPTGTTTSTDGTITWLWVGTTGTIGTPFASSSLTPTNGSQYFYGSKLFTCLNSAAMTVPNITAAIPTLAGATAGTVVTIGTTVFICTGNAATVTVNFSAGTVRSLTLTDAGSGYLISAPSLAILSTNGAGSAASATASLFQSIVNSGVSAITVKSPSAIITGSIGISSGGNSPLSGVGSLVTTNGGVNYTGATPIVGFGLPTGINIVASQGAGYGTTPTITVGAPNVTGGTPAVATAVVQGGKVVSIYITTGGSGYTSWPAITISGGGFTTSATLTATATLEPSLAKASVNLDPLTRSVASFTITNAGYGYLSAPSVVTTTSGSVTTAMTNGSMTTRLALYNLTYDLRAPATSSAPFTPGAEIPANNKVNNLVVGTSSAAAFAQPSLANNLEVMGTLSLPTSSVTSPSILNLNTKTLTFSNPTYTGVGGTPTFGYVTGGSVVFNSPGGSVTRTFPWNAPVVVNTGSAATVATIACTTANASTTVTTTSTSLIQPGQIVSGTNIPTGTTVVSVTNATTFVISAAATAAGTQNLTFTTGGSTVTQLTGTVNAAPTGAVTGSTTGTAIGNRSFRLQAIGDLGATGTITLNYNLLDTFAVLPLQTALFIGQSAATTGTWTVKSASTGTVGALIAPSATNTPRVTVSTVPGVPTPVNLADGGYFAWVTTTASQVTANSLGGLWSDPATWANGIVPATNDTAFIPDGAVVTIDGAYTVKGVKIGSTVTGGAVLQWNGSSNALTVIGDITVGQNSKFLPYTTASSPSGQIINIGGSFTLNGVANLATAGTVLNFNGSQQTGGSTSQEFKGVGTLIGDTINTATGGRGMIRTLQFASVGGTLSFSNWTGTQKLVTQTLNEFAGAINTAGKLSIDNTAQVFGQAFNRQVASIAVTNMGATFSTQPVAFGTTVTPAAIGVAATAGSYYYNSTNVYLCTVSGTFTSVPTGTGTTIQSIGATTLYVGALGTIGTPFINTALTIGQQYFYGDNLYLAVLTTAPGTTVPVHTTGTVGSFQYVGKAAKVAVNYNVVTRNVRSVTITDAGSGYLGGTSPSVIPTIVFSPGAVGASQTTNAAATAVVFQQIAGGSPGSTVRSAAASISGGISAIRNDQGVGGITTTYGGVNYSAVPAVGFPLPTNYLNLVGASGSGYTTAPTITLSGGSQIPGITTTPTFSVLVAQGRVVSVICTGGATGWLTLPALTVSGGGGTGATAAFPAGCLPTATVILNNDPLATTGSITDFKITNAGFDYESAPTPLLQASGAGGLTIASAAAAPTSRIGLYELNYTLTAPSLAANNIVYAEGPEVPANRRLNKLTMNSSFGANFTNDLEIYGNSTPLSLTAGVVNLASGKTLFFSHPGYRGTTGSTTTSVNAIIKLTSPGQNVTFNFPFDATLNVVTGSGTLTTGSFIRYLTAKITAAPTGTPGPNGTRSYELIADPIVPAISTYGTNPTVTLNYNANDALTVTRNADLYIGQSTATTGPWTLRSVTSGTGTLSATGSRTTAASTVGPIAPTGDDYFAWISPVPVITNVTLPAGGHCTPTAQPISADITPGSGTITTVTLNYSFNGTVQTPALTMLLGSGSTYSATIPAPATSNTVVTWNITAANSDGFSTTYTGTSYTDSTFSIADAVTISSSVPTFCGTGGQSVLTASSSAADVTYTWTSLGSGTLSTNTGNTTVATVTETSDFSVLATTATGCKSTKQVSVGVYPFPASTPFASPTSVCVGNSSILNSGLSASNFSVASIPWSPLVAPSNAVTLQSGATQVVAQTGTSSQDDGGWQGLPIGFNFNFFGNNYSAINIGTNGTVNFGTYTTGTSGGGIAQYDFSLNGGGFPNSANPANVIAVMASDLYFTGAATLKYWTTGTAPNRKFVVSYDNVSTFDTRLNVPNNGLVTAQCILYETTGNVEIHVTQATYSITPGTNSSRKYIGLQDLTKTIGATAPNTVSGQPNYWNGVTTPITSDAPLAWRFTPPHNYVVTYSPASQISGPSTGTNLFQVTLLPTAPGTVNYSVTFTDGVTGCNNSTSPAIYSLTVVPPPGVPTVTSPVTVCGPQSVLLYINNPSTVASTDVVNWYDQPTGGAILGTGVTFTTFVSSTKTFYVAEENSSCGSVRVPITVNITTPPPFAVNRPVLCAGVTSVQLNVTTPTAPFDTYIWSPVANLFEDAALTIPYLGRSLTTVYAGNLTPGITNYICSASSFGSLCGAKDSAIITIQPALAPTISSSAPSICVSGSAILTLNAASAIGNGYVQWQESSDNTTYTDIAGATGVSYTTPTLSADHYYKAIIKNGAGATCSVTNFFKQPVSNPQITSFTGGNRCGTGTVTLTATAATGTITWYTAANGGTALGTGTSFTTPSISTTTSYYAGVTVNACEGTRTEVVATVATPAAIVLTPAQAVCNNNYAQVSVTSTLSNYDTYTWTPVTNLYLDNTGTPYTAGTNASTVYVRTTTPGTLTYTVNASNAATLCSNTATAKVNTLPVSVTATASPAAICKSGTSTISITDVDYANAIIAWEQSTDGITYAPIAGENGTTLSTATLTVTTYFHALIKNSAGGTCIVGSAIVTINNPQATLTSSPNARCGTGSVTLTATAASGTINWYSAATGGTLLGTGPSYTATVTGNTTVYLGLTDAGCQGTRQAVLISVSTPPTLSVNTTSQTLSCASPIGSISVSSTPGNYETYVWTPITNLYTDPAGTVPYVAGTNATTVYVNSSTQGTTVYTVTGSNSTSPFCANATTSSVTVVATNPVSVAIPAQTVCNDAVATISVTTGLGSYDTYSWTPATNLFTDAAGTVPYIAGSSATTVYARTTTAGTTAYVLKATSNTSSCIGSDTAKVTVHPASVTASSNTSATLCRTGSVVFSLNAGIPVTSGIQWQSSTDGTNFTNISGATDSTYTGTVTTTSYFRVQLKNSAGTVCATSNAVLQNVNNPQALNPVDGARCGTGTVVLSATPSAGATLSWFSGSTGGTALGTGNSFTTPSIGSNTTFWVEASIGTCKSAARVAVVATIASAPAITVTPTIAICNNVPTKLEITSTVSNYDSYVWTPVTNLYTDAAGTIPYTLNTNTAIVYVKSSTASTVPVVYTVNATNSATSCAASGTVNVTVQPGSATAALASTATICGSGTSTMSITPSTGFAAGTIQWQSSTDDVTYANISGANSATYTTPTLSSSVYYRAQISNSAGQVCFVTNSNQVIVNNPQVNPIAPVSRCGAGTVTITATAASGTIRWYSAATGGTALSTGNSYTTPVLIASTTYYVGLTIGTCEGTRVAVPVTVTTSPVAVTVAPHTKIICNGAITQLSVTSALGDFSTYVWSPATNLYTDAAATVAYVSGSSSPVVYLKRTSAGAISYYCTATTSANCGSQDSCVINVQPSTAIITASPSSICTSGTSTLKLNPSSGFAANSVQWQESDDNTTFTDVPGATNATFTTGTNTSVKYYKAIVKDGTGATCFTTAVFTLGYSNPILTLATTRTTRCGRGTVTLSGTASSGATVNWYSTATGGLPLFTGNSFTTPVLTSTTIYYVSANTGTCASTRVADTAFVSTPPTFTVTAPQTVCNNSITPLTVTSTVTDYDTYKWSPATNLFTDAAATVPYVLNASASTVYTRTTTAGTVAYTVSATSVGGCAATTSTSVTTQVGSATISANPTSLCVNGTAILSLNPSTPYAPLSIQWERSTDLTTWVASPGAIDVTYITPLQATTRYYRALVKDGTGAACFTTAPFTLVANNPQITSTTPGSKCGTQAVTLSATAIGGATLRWYATSAGGTPLAIGGTFTTPVISTTTTYYVQASIGTCLSGMVPVVATITPPPALTITPSTTFCASTSNALSVTSTASNFDSYTWLPVTNLYTDAAATVAYVAGTSATTVYVKSTTVGSTVYTVTANNSGSGCVNTATTTIGIIKVTINTVVASPTTVCAGGASTLTATGAGTYNYVWNPGNISGNPVTVNPVTTGPNVYTVTATDPLSGCSTTGTVTVTATPLPSSPATAPSTQCGYGVPQAFAVGTSNGNYRWYLTPTGGTALAGETNSSLTAYAISTTTTFYVSIYNGVCESNRTSVLATVNQPDAVTATVDNNSICFNTGITLTAVKAAGPSVYTYTWTASPAAGSGIPTSALGAVQNITPTAAGTYVYTVTAVDNSVTPSCTQVSTISVTVKALPVITSATANPGTICVGISSTLTALTASSAAGTATIGAGATSTSDYNAPFYSLWSNKHMQILFKASELTASGLFAGDITTLSFPTTSGTVANADYSIKLGHTTASNIASFVTTGLTQVYAAPSQAQTANTNNTINLTTPFTWDGTSNIVLEICFGSSATTATLSSTSPADATPYVSVITTHQTVSTAGATICPDITSSIVSYSVRPKVLFGGQVGGLGAGSLNWSWTPGPLSGNVVTVTPPGTTTYTVTATDPATSCFTTAPVTVTVNQLPAQPTGTAAPQCGAAIPTVSVVSQSGLPSPVFKWYTQAVGGTAVQTSTSTTYESLINTTTDFYVSEVSPAGCESSRLLLHVDVSGADVVVATSSAAPHCPNSTVTLTVTQTVVANSYSYTWAAVPAAGSGIEDPVNNPLDGGSGDVSSVTVTPTAPGTYIYTVTAIDALGGCSNVASTTVIVSAPPVITSIGATPTVSCAGSPVVLSALSVPSSSSAATIGDPASPVSNGATGFPTSYGNYYWGEKTQILVKASELTAAGFVPGNITNMAFDVTDLNAVRPLINYTISIGTTTATALSTLQTTGLFTIFTSPSFMPVAGLNNHTFSTPFFWNGTSNIIVDICSNDGSFVTNGNASVRSTATSFNSVLDSHADNANVCSTPGAPNILTARPNITFTGQRGNNVTSALTWLWSPVGLSGSTVTVNPLVTTAYTVTATDPVTGCSTVSVPVNVTVNPVPDAPSTTNSDQCGYGVPTASVTGAGGTYKWYTAPTGGTLLQTGGSTYTTAISTTTTFYVSETSAAGCEGLRAAVTVNVTQPDPINATADFHSVCPNGTVQLAVENTATTPVNAYTYTWTAAPVTGSGMTVSVSGPTQTVNPSIANDYVYTVLAVDAGAGCTTIDTVQVKVNPNPVIDSVRAGSPTICSGASSILNVYSGIIGSGPQTAPTTYCADDNSGGGGSSYISSVIFNTLNNPTGAPPAPYTVVYPYSGNTTTTVSAGQTYAFSMTSSAASIASVWIDYNRDGVYSASEWQQVWTSASSGTINITIPSNAAAGATGMRVRTRGTGNTNGQDDACTAFFSGTSQDYTINILSVITQNPAFTYTWTPGPLTGKTVTVSPTTTTTYNVVATNATTGCSSPSVPVTVTVAPLAATAVATPSVSCSGSPVALTANATGGAPFTYIWSRGATVIGNTQIVTVNPTATTNYSVTVSDACNNTVTTTVTVTVNPLPTASISQAGPISLCSPATQTLTSVTNAGSPSYQWSLNGIAISGATSSSYTVSTISTGTYTVRISDGNTTCISAQSTGVVVTINPIPTAVTIAPNAPAAVCAGTVVTLNATGGALPGNVTIGTGTDVNGASVTLNMPPYGNYYTGNRHQILIRASELSAQGLSAGSQISALAFDVVSNSNALGYKDFSIRLGNTTALALTTTFLTSSTTEVYYSPNFSPSIGWSNHTFTAPYVWDGTSNIVVETSFSNCAVSGSSSCSGTTCTGAGSGTTYTQNAVTNQSPTDYPSHAFYYSDAEGCNPQGQAIASSLVNERPNIRFVATLPAPITWSPATGLYTDAAATTAYVSGQPATTLYAKPATTTSYTATATNAAGCANVSSGTATVTVKPIPPAPVVVVTDNGNGTSTLTATGYTGTLVWTPGGATTPSITITGTGTYSVTQTVNGCTSAAGFSTATPTITADPAVGQMDITDQFDASQDANTLTFTQGYKLNLPVYNFEQDFSVPDSSTKLVVDLGTKLVLTPGFNLNTVLPAYFSWSAPDVVSVPGHTILRAQQIAPIPGDFEAMAVFSVQGSLSCTSTISADFVVDNAGSDITLVDLVTNNNHATLQYTFPVTLAPTFTNVTCFNAANGTIAANASPGTTITVNGNPYSSTATYGPGTYTIVATATGDTPPGNTCSQTATVTITQPTQLAAVVTQTNIPGCHGDLTGAAAVFASGGTAPYTYLWSPGGQTTVIATGLGAGVYTVTVTDANLCTVTGTVTINEPTLIVPTISAQTNVDCHGNNTGSATVSVTGGTPGYTYSWNTTPVQTTATATGLTAGVYTVTVTDTHGCIKTVDATITEPDALTAPVTQTDVSCNGANDGTATVTPTGGTTPYTYLWSNGQTGATATSLAPNTYTVTVTDAHNCVITSNVVTITQPAVLNAVATATNVSCNNAGDGTATVAVTGGTGPYTYLWSNGQTGATATGLVPANYSVVVTDLHSCVATSNIVTVTQPIAVTVSGVAVNVSCFGAANGSITVTNSAGSTVVITNAANADVTLNNGFYGPGIYTLTATAPNGNNNGVCTATSTVTITEPIEVTVGGTATNVTCFGANNGSIAVTNSVGSTVVITNSSNVDVTSSNGSYGPGTYTLTASAPNGNNNGSCTATAVVVITQPALLTISTTQTNNSCHGGATGKITATANGGTLAYAYTISGPVNTTGATSGIFTGLAAGTYTVTVTDSHSCTAVSSSVIVTEPSGTLPDISLGADYAGGNLFIANGFSKTIVYNVSEIGGNPSVGDTLRITKVAGYNFTFDNTLTANPVAPANTLDNPRWKVDNSNPAFVSLIFDPAHNSTPGTMNCSERVYISIRMTRATPNLSTFTVSARLRKANNEVNLTNNLYSIVFSAE